MPQSTETTSLSELVLHGSAPSLLSRIGMAVEPATSLYFLHAVNWLHKGLRDQSILILLRDGAPDYSQPYITGFEYSRPDEIDMTTTTAPDGQDWAVYTHPDYQGIEKKKYRKTFDMYSLGIILLEIAMWKPAEDILGFSQPSKASTIKKADKSPEEQEGFSNNRDESPEKRIYSKTSLLDLQNIKPRLLVDEPYLLGQVRMTMGDCYHDAVRACIGGLEYFKLPPDVDESRDVVATLLQQAYLHLVVDVLRGIRV